MITIYCSSKFKEFFKPVISQEIPLSVGQCWNANLFYVKGRKCVAFLDKETAYVVVLFDIVKKDIKNIQTLFAEALIQQFYNDHILSKEQESGIRNHLESLCFRPTDNDRKAIGSLNDTIYRITLWKDIEVNPVERIKNYCFYHINETPMGIINNKLPMDVMKEKIKRLAGGGR